MTAKSQSLKTRIQQLPPLPPATSRLLEMLENDEVANDLKQVEKQILADPVLTGRILQVANSSFYGLRQEVVSISQACSILGIHTLKNLVYTMALMQRLNQPHAESVLDYSRVWRHSLLTACLAGEITSASRLNSIAAFTTGLFHNIGLLIMDLLYPRLLSQQIEQARKHQYPLDVATREMGSPSHLSVAATTLEVWNIPESIIAPFRQGPVNDDRHRRCSSALNWVRLCALLAHGMGETCLEGVPLPTPEEVTEGYLDKDLSELLPAIQKGRGMYQELKANLL